jgi:hypothetical protein
MRSGLTPIQSLFRKQPLLTTALTMGAVDGLMGASEGKVSLALLGLALAGSAITLRWRQVQRVPVERPRPPVVLYLSETTPAWLEVWSQDEAAPLLPERPGQPEKNDRHFLDS